MHSHNYLAHSKLASGNAHGRQFDPAASYRNHNSVDARSRFSSEADPSARCAALYNAKIYWSAVFVASVGRDF